MTKVETYILIKLLDSIYLKQTLVLYYQAHRMDSARISQLSSQWIDIRIIVESMCFQADKLEINRPFIPKKMIHQFNISTRNWLRIKK